MYFEQFDEYNELANASDAMREFAFNIGDQVPNRQWILTDYDVWVINPHYNGPPQPHPEMDDF